MSKEEWMEALGEISDEHIEEAAETMASEVAKWKRRRKKNGGIMVACIAFVIIAAAVSHLWMNGDKESDVLQASEENVWFSADSEEVLLPEISEENYIDYGSDADLYFEDYEGLKKKAGMIVKAEVLDDLSDKNSVKSQVEGSGYPIASVRKIRIMKIYQNQTGLEWKEGDVVEVEQAKGIVSMNGEYYFATRCSEECLLRKNRTYILYLNRMTDARGEDISLTGNRVVITGNGAVELDNLEENHELFYKEMIQGLVEYESDCDAEIKEMFLNADQIIPATSASELEQPQFIKFTLETAMGTGKVVLEYKQTEKGLVVYLSQY